MLGTLLGGGAAGTACEHLGVDYSVGEARGGKDGMAKRKARAAKMDRMMKILANVCNPKTNLTFLWISLGVAPRSCK